MARISQSTLTQIGGPDAVVLVQSLTYPFSLAPPIAMTDIDPMALTYGGIPLQIPVDLSNATFTAQITRRTVSDYVDGRGGLSFTLSDYPGATDIDIPVTNINAADGKYNIVLESADWGISPTDPLLAINAANPIVFTGYLNIHFAQVAQQPAYDQTYSLCFLVSGNGTTA